jgi:plasmid stabilization system protein ParE
VNAQVSFTERFKETVGDLAVTLAEHSSREHAERVVEEVLAKARSLSHMPRRGRIVPELQDELYRELIVVKNQYRLVYRTNSEATVVDVLFVFYAPRGFPYDEIIDA